MVLETDAEREELLKYFPPKYFQGVQRAGKQPKRQGRQDRHNPAEAERYRRANRRVQGAINPFRARVHPRFDEKENQKPFRRLGNFF